MNSLLTTDRQSVTLLRPLVNLHFLNQTLHSPHICFIIDAHMTVKLGNNAFCDWLQIGTSEMTFSDVRIADHLSLPRVPGNSDGMTSPKNRKDNITLQNVCFQYEPDVKASVVSVKSISRAGHRMVSVKPVEEWDFLTSRLHQLIEEEDFVRTHTAIYEQLTQREKEILLLICEGLNSVEIADKLFVSHHTVSQHRKNVYKKLNASTIVDLFRYGRLFGNVQE